MSQARDFVWNPCLKECKRKYEGKPPYDACALGCHAAAQAAYDICESNLNRCLGRDPIEKPRYEDYQKQRFGPSGDIATAGGAFVAGVGVVMLTEPAVAATFVALGGGFFVVGAGLILTGLYLYHKAADPIDDNFKSRARPRPPKQFLVKAQPGTPMDADVAKAINAVLENQAKAIGVDRAMMTSINRAQGAAAAEEQKYEKLQMKYARSYAGELAKLLRQSAGLRSKAAIKLRDNGVVFSITEDQAFRIRETLVTKGLPAKFKRILADYCENADERKEVLLRFMSQLADVHQFEVTVPDILSKPKLASAEKKIASALEEFSRSTYISL